MQSVPSGSDHALRSYLTGFVLALILTVIPFALIAANSLPRPLTLIIIAVAAVIQILVHLRYFLHLDLKSTPRENLA
ncbi:MAG: cytochrome o ubiquinol oxidase subunit IV, partial [Rhizobiales bacterium]|nr:cytochrome o ubiquinol oxidase subunit IV [Hyphomicrobiales bacterium]